MRGLFIGVDESNSCSKVTEPMVTVAAMCDNERYARVSENVDRGKHREKGANKFLSQYNRVRYSYLATYPRLTERVYPIEKIPGVTFASLLAGRVEQSVDELTLLVDGELTTNQTNYARFLLAEILGLERGKISINSGSKYDIRCNIVNIADARAYCLSNNLGNNGGLTDKHRVKLFSRQDLKSKLRHLRNSDQRVLLRGITPPLAA